MEHTTTKTAQERCPKCPRLVTSIYQSGNKKFYNHGEGGSIDWNCNAETQKIAEYGQAFDLKFDDYCTVEIGTEPKAKANFPVTAAAAATSLKSSAHAAGDMVKAPTKK
jgi:hypothetical protein